MVAVDDPETLAILMWAYLRGRIWNGTFAVAELAQVNADRYSAGWRERLFAQLATDPAGPRANSGGRYDLKEYIKAINDRTDLSPEAKQKILTPFAQR